MGAIAAQITSLTILYSSVYSGADQSKHQSSASLAFVWGIHRGPVNSPHKWPVTRKMFPFDDVIMGLCYTAAHWLGVFMFQIKLRNICATDILCALRNAKHRCLLLQEQLLIELKDTTFGILINSCSVDPGYWHKHVKSITQFWPLLPRSQSASIHKRPQIYLNESMIYLL